MFDAEAETAKAIGRELRKRFRVAVADSIYDGFAESTTRNALINYRAGRGKWRQHPWARPPWQSGRRKSVCCSRRERWRKIWELADQGIGEEW